MGNEREEARRTKPGTQPEEARASQRAAERARRAAERAGAAAVRRMAARWTVPGVVRLLCAGEDAALVGEVRERGVRVERAAGAQDRFDLGDGDEVVERIDGWRGSAEPAPATGGTIYLQRDLSNAEAASTLFHELRHLGRSGGDPVEEEIAVTVETEAFRARSGLPPLLPAFRRADGTVDEAAIRDHVRASPHYNPAPEEGAEEGFPATREYPGHRPAAGAWACPGRKG